MLINEKMEGRLCLLGGLVNGVHRPLKGAARNLGREMAESKIDLVCLGNASGMVYDVAKAVKAYGGSVTCIVTNTVKGNDKLIGMANEIRSATNLHECKMLLFDSLDGLAVLPDSVGTLDMLMEYLTWMQRVYGKKPLYILNQGETSSLMLEMFQNMKAEEFLPENFDERYTVIDDISEIVPNFLKNISY